MAFGTFDFGTLDFGTEGGDVVGLQINSPADIEVIQGQPISINWQVTGGK